MKYFDAIAYEKSPNATHAFGQLPTVVLTRKVQLDTKAPLTNHFGYHHEVYNPQGDF